MRSLVIKLFVVLFCTLFISTSFSFDRDKQRAIDKERKERKAVVYAENRALRERLKREIQAEKDRSKRVEAYEKYRLVKK